MSNKSRAISVRRKQPDWGPPRKRFEFHVNPIIQILFGAAILAGILWLIGGQKPIISNDTNKQIVTVVITATPLPPAKKVSPEGLRTIRFFENYYETAYFDVGKHCTIGIGHLVDPIWCIGELKAKESDIELWFNKDIRNTEQYLSKKVGMVKLNQCQFDALASFHFNLGDYHFDYSGMIEALQNDDLEAILKVFSRFVYSEGIGPIKGMQVRRAAEAKLFEECVYPI